MSVERPMDGELALVAGASRGLGRACALAYARAGAHVVAVGRTVGALEELDDEIRGAGAEAVLVPLDLTDFPAITRLATALAERFGRLDLLLGAAADAGVQTPLGHVSDKDFDATLALNLGASWRLLRAFDPLLRAAPAGRALFMTCEAAEANGAYQASYAASKAGLEAVVRTYARENRQTAVTANLLDPGPARTRLRARRLPNEDTSALPEPEAFAERIVVLSEEAKTRNGMLWHGPSGEWVERRPR